MGRGKGEFIPSLGPFFLQITILGIVADRSDTTRWLATRVVKLKCYLFVDSYIMVITPSGFTHSHRDNIPTSGNKYTATSWIMFNRAEKIYKTT